MRDIKFRIFDGIEMNYNVIGFDYNCGGIKRDIVTTFHEKYGVEFYRIDNNFPLMQYTGIKDKNGKEIYEGDIVKFLDEVTVKEEGYLDRTSVVEKVGVVVWDNEELGYNVDVKCENEYHYLCCCEEVEVIGNIYENPELLK